MFADDTLLLSKTPMGMQRALDAFCLFCENRKLEININKTKYMVLHAGYTTRPPLQMNGKPLERVTSFEYLGVTLNDKMEWGPQIDKANLRLTQSVGGILKVYRSCSVKTISPPIEIYKAQAQGASLYGAELWGHCSSQVFALSENAFIRQLLALPSSTPLVPLRMDLGILPIADLISVRPILFWRRLWSTPELSEYKDELKAVMAVMGAERIPWLSYIKEACNEIGMGELWTTSEDSCPCVSKKSLAKALNDHQFYCIQQNVAPSSLTSTFIGMKQSYKLEITLDIIQPLIAKKLFLQFRHGSLPLFSFTNKWAGAIERLCPGCLIAEESTIHVIFFCPAYKKSRSKWILQLCRNLGVRRLNVALKLLKNDTNLLTVVSISKFLFSMWCTRRYLLDASD